jgi:hypothetical protein
MHTSQAQEPAQAAGLWQLHEEVPWTGDPARQANDVHTFRYRGAEVTLRLLTLRAGQWKSPDDFYLLAARWQGNRLLYRPPFGPWSELASFEDGRFVNTGNGRKRIFHRISEEQVVPWNRAILADRTPHDYRRQPDGSLKEME